MRPQATPTALLLTLLLPVFGLAQTDTTQKKATPKKEHRIIGIGVRAGLNFANVTNASDINASTQTGFHAGIFLSPPAKIIGSYTELLFSRQGYNYSTSQTNSKLMLDYIWLAQLMAINITKYVQIQFGFRTAYLLNAKTDSAAKSPLPDSLGKYNSLLSYFNRFDYGLTGGLEVHPALGLVVGARYNLSFSNLYKNAFTSYSSGGQPNISINPKNNLIQVFIGWRF